jgi:hypothetical protein
MHPLEIYLEELRAICSSGAAVAALILLQPELDKNYQTVKAATVSL